MSSYNNFMYLFAGISHKLCNDLRIFDIETLEWRPESSEEEKDENGSQMLILNCADIIPEARFGHTLLRDGSTLILYGGENKYDKIRKRRELFIGIHKYDLRIQKWVQASSKESIIEGRKHHAAAIMGKLMIVHGGYNCANKIIDEMAYYHISESYFVLFESVKNTLG